MTNTQSFQINYSDTYNYLTVDMYIIIIRKSNICPLFAFLLLFRPSGKQLFVFHINITLELQFATIFTLKQSCCSNRKLF